MSQIVHGQMKMGSWNMTARELGGFFMELVDMGVTSFDHADIYGNYTCEAILGEVLGSEPGLRNKIEIITKCGIKLKSDKFPERKIKYYDYSYDHIVTSVHNSLKNFRTDYIDLLLLHRPAPFFDPEAAARAFSDLKRDGKVLNFGVSNFLPGQYEMFSRYSPEKLITNQVEISPLCLEHFENGNIDFFLKEKLPPMAWSPMAGGRVLNPGDDRGATVLKALTEVAENLGIHPVDKVVYAWLLKHPVQILPVVGTGNIGRVRAAVEAMEVEMSLEQWYSIYIASRGHDLP